MELALYETRLGMNTLVPERQRYEWGNILDRLMINLYNGVPRAVDKAREECTEKHIDAAVVDQAVDKLRANRENREKREKVEKQEKGKGAKLSSRVLPDRHTREMYVYLKQRYPRLSENELTRCTLRYASLGQGGQQWALNRAMMERIHRQGIATEAFASPFNNYFSKYFSIFKSDAPFGSQGSFFQADVKQLTGGLYANPPFTAAALEGMAERLCAAVQKNNRARFVVITPTWSDAPWYAALERCGFQKTLKHDTAYFRLGEEFTPKFTTTLWTRNVTPESILV